MNPGDRVVRRKTKERALFSRLSSPECRLPCIPTEAIIVAHVHQDTDAKISSQHILRDMPWHATHMPWHAMACSVACHGIWHAMVYAMACHAHAMACHGICHGLPCHVPWHAMACQCHGICHGMPRHMPWHMPCHGMPWHMP